MTTLGSSDAAASPDADLGHVVEGAPGGGDGADPVDDAGSVERRKKRELQMDRAHTAGWNLEKAIGEKMCAGGVIQQTMDRAVRREVRDARKELTPGEAGALAAQRHFEMCCVLQQPRGVDATTEAHNQKRQRRDAESETDASDCSVATQLAPQLTEHGVRTCNLSDEVRISDFRFTSISLPSPTPRRTPRSHGAPLLNTTSNPHTTTLFLLATVRASNHCSLSHRR